jgi:hypothetical protein
MPGFKLKKGPISDSGLEPFYLSDFRTKDPNFIKESRGLFLLSKSNFWGFFSFDEGEPH